MKIKQKLDEGVRLKDIGASPGAITVLRWVVGSCRAYLKETKTGEGVIEDQGKSGKSHVGIGHYRTAIGSTRQFTFVVGSPQQEEGFQNEIKEAQKKDANCKQYPTILAFHGKLISSDVVLITELTSTGSAAERWHNILRTGLDYNETVCGRVSFFLGRMVRRDYADEYRRE